MALPTLAKTWQYNVNNLSPSQGSALASNKRVIRLIKDAMIGFASSPWTVVSSSNASVANSSDNWASDTDITMDSGAHSWIVLKQTGIASNFQICFDLNSASSYYMTYVVSQSAGFTGGSTTARPTATDEMVCLSSSQYSNNAADIGLRWSVMQSTDGECTRILICGAGSLKSIMILDKPANPITGWTNPFYTFWQINATYSTYFTNYVGKIRAGSTDGTINYLQEGWNSRLASEDITWGNIANEISGEWGMYPLGFACDTTGIRGRHGSVYDLWAGSSSVAAGDTYPADGSNQFVHFGCLIFPWNGGSVNLT